MKLFFLFLVFFVATVSADDKCGICKASVKSIKDSKELAYTAELTTEQIENIVNKHVKKNCHAPSICQKLIKSLIEIADQLDDDLDATPAQLCKFVYQC
ncbi:hypothetical protein GCK72_021815 [Caenorhabditis remanei]|uniref:Saposin B-type domain-containing protein n=1 Tax=Caenorhabditis remanei TaxID=31234 RepID=A0A6A5GKV4_CAERE|nr:hypothetical protein GCK72_021815 [Caenorhabditis remanei]KAF1755246.1 hypothetical protein GCK72_021815 [Caenorhabditis remanei]